MGYFIVERIENPDFYPETDYYEMSKKLGLDIDFDSTDEKYLLQKSTEIGILFQKVQDKIDNINERIKKLIKKQSNSGRLKNEELEEIADDLSSVQKMQKNIKLIKDFLDSKI